MPIEEDLWRGRRVLLTGHTGFKGAWLSLWLQRLGAQVSGLAPSAPSDPSLYCLARVGDGMTAEHAIDVRDREGVSRAVAATKPEVVLHLAAQPMVRRSLLDPVSTYEINVMGTVNVLEAVREAADSVQAVLIVTSDKCYENPPQASGRAQAVQAGDRVQISGGGQALQAGDRVQTSGRAQAVQAGDRVQASGRAQAVQAGGPGGPPGDVKRPFREGDPLGGEDPYSSSKACAELVAAAYRGSFFGADGGPRLATARAGNVIGGGDWGEDRLLPDAVRAASGRAAPLSVRSPDAVRPWQHVLNPLMGYLLLAQRLLQEPCDGERDDPGICGAWNFGPPVSDAKPVGWVIERLRELWHGVPAWEVATGTSPSEAAWLALDSTKAQQRLGWRTVWELDRGLRELVAWHSGHLAEQDMRAVTLDQIERFAEDGVVERGISATPTPARSV